MSVVTIRTWDRNDGWHPTVEWEEKFFKSEQEAIDFIIDELDTDIFNCSNKREDIVNKLITHLKKGEPIWSESRYEKTRYKLGYQYTHYEEFDDEMDLKELMQNSNDV